MVSTTAVDFRAPATLTGMIRPVLESLPIVLVLDVFVTAFPGRMARLKADPSG